MRVFCDQCQRWYNDEFCWTICPHNPLEGGHLTGDYCRRHDFFKPCPICNLKLEDGNATPGPTDTPGTPGS